MPRARPQDPLKPRAIRLSDAEYMVFRQLGGSDWLRSRIGKLRMLGRTKAIRNRSIRIEAARGDSHARIAIRHGVCRTTVWRIVNGHKD